MLKGIIVIFLGIWALANHCLFFSTSPLTLTLIDSLSSCFIASNDGHSLSL